MITNLTWGKYSLDIGRRTLVMGVLNVTPDSFSDGGRFFDAGIAVSQAMRLVEEGADILDVGGESTRPFSESVSEEEELRRVLPVIDAVAHRISIPVSIDTMKAAVAEKAIEAGAALINDVSALRHDPDMPALAAEKDVPLILMHMKGTPKTMQVDPVYEDLIGEIKAFLSAAVQTALDGGVSESRLIIDPGIGFGKTVAHNLRIIRRLYEFNALGLPILVGPSRKAFIRNILKPPGASDISPDLPEVETGTQAAVTAAVLNGAHIVRVHHVANASAAVRIADAVKNA